MKQIVIKILPNGEIKAETIGVKGGECMKYIDVLEKLTNAKVTDSAFTEEFLQTEAQTEVYDEQEVALG